MSHPTLYSLCLHTTPYSALYLRPCHTQLCTLSAFMSPLLRTHSDFMSHPILYSVYLHVTPFFFFFYAPWAYCYIIFQCGRCIRNPAPGRMRYAYIFSSQFAQSVIVVVTLKKLIKLIPTVFVKEQKFRIAPFLRKVFFVFICRTIYDMCRSV